MPIQKLYSGPKKLPLYRTLWKIIPISVEEYRGRYLKTAYFRIQIMAHYFDYAHQLNNFGDDGFNKNSGGISLWICSLYGIGDCSYQDHFPISYERRNETSEDRTTSLVKD
jgi:hypothetical protein